MVATECPDVVPDLTFSELRFLNATQARRATNPMPEKKKPKKKDIDHNEELSRFFASTSAPSRREVQDKSRERVGTRPDYAHRKKSEYRKIESNSESLPTAHVDLPNRPFLGFGEPGPRPPSLLDPNESLPSVVSSAKKPTSASIAHSTSYFTWSQSPVTEAGFINRIPHYSEIGSHVRTDGSPRPESFECITNSKILTQQPTDERNVIRPRKCGQTKSHNAEPWMYGALSSKGHSSTLRSLSPRTIPRLEDERRELESFLAKRSREYDLRTFDKRDSLEKSPKNSSNQACKSRGPPVFMEGTEALLAVLDSWFEKHERRFARLATARTESPDQNHKEVQEIPSSGRKSRKALQSDEQLGNNVQSQEPREYPTEAPRRPPSSHGAGSAQAQQNAQCFEPRREGSLRPHLETSLDTNQQALDSQSFHRLASARETCDSAIALAMNRFSGMDPRTCHQNVTTDDTQQRQLRPSVPLVLGPWREPGTVYGQHLEDDAPCDLPVQHFEADTFVHTATRDPHCVHSPTELNVNLNQSEHIKFSAHSDCAICKFPYNYVYDDQGTNSAISHDYKQPYPEEDTYQSEELFNDQMLYPEIQKNYLNLHVDCPIPTHIHHPCGTSSGYPFEADAVEYYDERNLHISAPYNVPHSVPMLRTWRRSPSSIGRLARNREVLDLPLNEMEAGIPMGFWRPGPSY